VADVRSTGLNTPPESDYFLPPLQRPETAEAGPVTFAVFADTCGNLIQLYQPA
jgi:hypothetical protein